MTRRELLRAGVTAAERLLPGPTPVPEVVAPTERRVAGVHARRSRRIDPREAMTWRGVPVTNVARTLIDLAAVLSSGDLARACHEAGVRHGTTPAQVEAVLARWPNRPGAAQLRAVLRGDVRVTLSALERRSSRACERPGCNCRRPTGRQVAGGSIAAGPLAG